jgi:hypothetical protein
MVGLRLRCGRAGDRLEKLAHRPRHAGRAAAPRLLVARLEALMDTETIKAIGEYILPWVALAILIWTAR